MLDHLELLKLALLDALNPVSHSAISQGDGTVVTGQGNLDDRIEGRDWPLCGTTMIGLKRMTNIEQLIFDVLNRRDGEVEGDYIETGVWRGGAAIFARACLDFFGASDRLVYACDSFEGLPKPDAQQFPADAGDLHHTVDFLAASRQEVEDNFRRFGIEDGVRFIEGWFRDTLPRLADKTFAIVRLDGDMYESTIQGLDCLYPQLSPGGYLIVDDYGAVEGCREAVHDFRELHGINAPIEKIDWTGAFWRKERG